MNRDKLEAAIVGGMVGAAAAMLPGYMTGLRGRWGEFAKGAAVTAGVATLGYNIDSKHPIEGMLLGLAWGSTKLLPKASVPMIGKMPIDDVVNLANGGKATVEREASNVARGMITAVPDPARRAAIAEAVDKGDLSGLSPTERKVADVWKQISLDYGTQAKNAGLIQDLIQNYVAHIVEKTSQPQTMVQQVMAEVFGGPSGVGGMGGKPGFFKPRKYDTFADLQKALQGSGLQVKTMDIAEISHAYIMGVGKALANKRLIDNLQQAKSGPAALIAKIDKAPQGYVTINAPQLRGMAVHPDIAPSLKFVMERNDPGAFKNAALALSMATKRLATGLSYFHAANLMNAYLAANGLEAVGAKSHIDAALKLYRNGGQGDVVDIGLRNGLRVEAGRPGESDLQAMTKLGALMDHYVERATGFDQKFGEGALGRFERFQRKYFDSVTWDYLHTGMKLSTFIAKFEKAIANGEHEKPGMDRDKVAAQVASFVNDTFGGLDWYRVATETESAFGRKMAMNVLSPGARQSLQILMFAPDWTMSTFRALYKALPNSKQMPLTTKLHQGYVMRTALMYAILMNGYNMALSGHPIWQNPDYGHSPTRIDNGDGTETQVAKHAMEGAEVLMNPRQAALDKMGFIPKQLLEQLSGREYLRAEGEAPKIKSRTGHLLNSLAPIPMQEGLSSDRAGSDKVKRWIGSTMGLPTYGITTKERAQLKEKRSADRDIRAVKKLLGEDVDE